MKTIIILFLILLVAEPVISQQKIITVTGQLTDNQGEPLPGVNIVIKGTQTGTISDLNGFYSIEAPVGSVLSFNFIGFVSEEIVVSEEMAAESKLTETRDKDFKQKPDIINDSDTAKLNLIGSPGTAIAVFSDQSATFNILDLQQSRYFNRYYINHNNSGYKLDPKTVWKIKTSKSSTNNYQTVYNLKTNKVCKLYFPKVYYFTSFSVDEIYRQREIQAQFSQGMPSDGKLQWFGAESGVPYSWGPDIRLLEYDGSVYDFDQHGRLVPAGTGNGEPAKIYNPFNFFKNGAFLTNKIRIEDKIRNFGYAVSYQKNHTKGIIPGVENNNHNTGLKLNYSPEYNFNINGHLMYSSSDNQLALSGSNLLRLMKSISLTPPTFDNSGFYQPDDGSARSYNPGGAFNPYWLINNIPDNEKNNRFISSLEIIKNISSSQLSYKFAYDNQCIDNTYGLAANNIALNNGVITRRNENYRMIHNAITYNHFLRLRHPRIEADLSAAIQSDYHERTLFREDNEGYQAVNPDFLLNRIYLIDTLNNRSTFMFNTIGNFRYRNILNVKIANSVNWSSTLAGNKGNFNPNAGLSINFSELRFWTKDHIFCLRVFSNFVHTLSEAPLNYAFGKYNSLMLNPEFSNLYYEWHEILYDERLNPEMQNKFNAGFAAGLFSNRFTIDFNYYLSAIKDYIVPVTDNSMITLINGAIIRDNGYEISISFIERIRALGNLKTQFNFSLGHSNPVVTSIYEPNSQIKIAGFQTVGSYLAEDQPYGVFIGSRYLRNENRKIIIGPDGFPVKDPEPGIIGNPNPDWNLGIEGKLEWKQFSLLCLVDIRKGGDIWNGTINTMNYYGVSETSADLRNTRNYIFDGVMYDGSLNTVAVDFANPAQSMEQNRWVRYGEDGVDEDAVMDGSYLRIKEAKIEYNFSLRKIFRFPANARMAAFGRNLFISNKNHLRPWNTFSGQPEGNGFEYFNLPGTRSYGLAFEISF